MTTLSRCIFVLSHLLLTQQLQAQNWQPNVYKPVLSPEGKFTLSYSWKPGTPAECSTGVIAIKGAGIADSVVVSATSCHDCPQARFFWSKNAPLLVIETNNGQCEGPRYTKVFDLAKLSFSYSRLGQLWLFDEARDIAIVSVGPDETEDSAPANNNAFKLYAYDIKKNRRTLIFSLESEHSLYDPLGGLSIEFDPKNQRTVAIGMSRMSNAVKIKIRY